MIGIPKVTMTMRELDRLKCVQGVVDRQLKLYPSRRAAGPDNTPGASAGAALPTGRSGGPYFEAPEPTK